MQNDINRVYEYLSKNRFNCYYIFMDGNNIDVICRDLKINKEVFNNSLNELVLTDVLTKELVATMNGKRLDEKTQEFTEKSIDIYCYR